jgi:hypothetical protein
MSRKMMLLLVVAITAALTAAVIEFLPQTVFFPLVQLSAPGGMQMTFLQPGRTERAACDKIADDIVRAFGGKCPDCKIFHDCVRSLTADQRQALSREPIAQPSARMESGAMTITFAAADPNFAMAACRESEKQSAGQAAGAQLRCYPAGAPR